MGASLFESRFVEVTSGIPAHPARTRGAGVRQASDVACVAASVTTIVSRDAHLHSFSLMPPVGAGAHVDNLAPRQLPNKRLKLAGVIALREAECCALARTNYRSTTDALASESPAA